MTVAVGSRSFLPSLPSSRRAGRSASTGRSRGALQRSSRPGGRRTGCPSVLQGVAFRDPALRDEIGTLERARGRGYVRLLAYDAARGAMLLEALGEVAWRERAPARGTASHPWRARRYGVDRTARRRGACSDPREQGGPAPGPGGSGRGARSNPTARSGFAMKPSHAPTAARRPSNPQRVSWCIATPPLPMPSASLRPERRQRPGSSSSIRTGSSRTPRTTSVWRFAIGVRCCSRRPIRGHSSQATRRCSRGHRLRT